MAILRLWIERHVVIICGRLRSMRGVGLRLRLCLRLRLRLSLRLRLRLCRIHLSLHRRSGNEHGRHRQAVLRMRLLLITPRLQNIGVRLVLRLLMPVGMREIEVGRRHRAGGRIGHGVGRLGEVRMRQRICCRNPFGGIEF